MQIFQVLQKGTEDLRLAGIQKPWLEAEILLLTAIGQNQSREWLLVNSDYKLDNSTIEQFNSFLERRKKFEPVAFITNYKEFYGYDFYVDNHVLIPRPESEILVEKAVKIVSAYHLQAATYKLIELGTGSGCIIISIIKELQKQKVNLSNFKFTATDISKDAIGVAQKNARLHQVDQLIQFIQSDLFDQIIAPNSRPLTPNFNLIIANLPYVPSYWLCQSEWAKTLYFEPEIALDGGKNGLDIYRQFFQEVSKYLVKDGKILIECEDDQVEKILKILEKRKGKFSPQIFRDHNNLRRTIQISATPGVDY